MWGKGGATGRTNKVSEFPSFFPSKLEGNAAWVKTFPSIMNNTETPRISKHAIFQPSGPLQAKWLVEGFGQNFLLIPFTSSPTAILDPADLRDVFFLSLLLFLSLFLSFIALSVLEFPLGDPHCLLREQVWREKLDRDGWFCVLPVQNMFLEEMMMMALWILNSNVMGRYFSGRINYIFNLFCPSFVKLILAVFQSRTCQFFLYYFFFMIIIIISTFPFLIYAR